MQHIYRFRITSDDNDDFLRVIDIPANFTFLELHHYLYKILKLEGNELASFYILDNKYNKKKEITLIDMNVNDDENAESILLMENVKLNQIIDDPHQKLAYVYDFMNMYTFNLELIKTFQGKEHSLYPQIIESIGEPFIETPPFKNLIHENVLTESEFNNQIPDEEDLKALLSDDNQELDLESDYFTDEDK
ncbi:MAG: plasmid pRiA4b ORF-3 family protein [Bacteroidales bacterium]|nr:plasmid pRiA4b ORF-3 family protein [Bacteroidales bacterium]